MSTDGPRVPGLRERFAADRTLQAVAVLVAIAFLLRIVLLGVRVAHFDEGRVAYWVLHWVQTDEFHYRYIIHGPFIQHVDRVLFQFFGPSDFTARLPVAVAGTLLPASALWFRDRLRDLEVVSLAAFLALNPIILYYSRFMRSTLLVAAFCFAAFALFVRAFDHPERWRYYSYGAVALWSLGFAAKENALVYLLCWIGASVLVANDVLYRSGLDPVRDAWAGWKRRHPRGERSDAAVGYVLFGLGALLLVFVVTLYFYAPRSPGVPFNPTARDPTRGVGFWSALGNPERLPALVQATNADIQQGLQYWFGRPSDTDNLADTYIKRLGRFFATTIEYAAPLFALSIAGFVIERFASKNPRPVVMFAGYWGFASVIGYPLGTDIWAAWIIVNALVPLAIPAAVGLGLILRAGRDALASEDRVSVGAVAVLLLLMLSLTGYATATGVYLHPTSGDNTLVQYAQPEQQLRDTIHTMDAVSTGPSDTDVLVYGDYFVDGHSNRVRKPSCVQWFNLLPLPWYWDAHGVDVTCAQNASQLPAKYPPIVIAKGEFGSAGVTAPAPLGQRIPDRYDRRVVQLRTSAVPMVVYVDEERVPDR